MPQKAAGRTDTDLLQLNHEECRTWLPHWLFSLKYLTLIFYNFSIQLLTMDNSYILHIWFLNKYIVESYLLWIERKDERVWKTASILLKKTTDISNKCNDLTAH